MPKKNILYDENDEDLFFEVHFTGSASSASGVGSDHILSDSNEDDFVQKKLNVIYASDSSDGSGNGGRTNQNEFFGFVPGDLFAYYLAFVILVSVVVTLLYKKISIATQLSNIRSATVSYSRLEQLAFLILNENSFLLRQQISKLTSCLDAVVKKDISERQYNRLLRLLEIRKLSSTEYEILPESWDNSLESDISMCAVIVSTLKNVVLGGFRWYTLNKTEMSRCLKIIEEVEDEVICFQELLLFIKKMLISSAETFLSTDLFMESSSRFQLMESILLRLPSFPSPRAALNFLNDKDKLSDIVISDVPNNLNYYVRSLVSLKNTISSFEVSSSDTNLSYEEKIFDSLKAFYHVAPYIQSFLNALDEELDVVDGIRSVILSLKDTRVTFSTFQVIRNDPNHSESKTRSRFDDIFRGDLTYAYSRSMRLRTHSIHTMPPSEVFPVLQQRLNVLVHVRSVVLNFSVRRLLDNLPSLSGRETRPPFSDFTENAILLPLRSYMGVERASRFFRTILETQVLMEGTNSMGYVITSRLLSIPAPSTGQEEVKLIDSPLEVTKVDSNENGAIVIPSEKQLTALVSEPNYLSTVRSILLDANSSVSNPLLTDFSSANSAAAKENKQVADLQIVSNSVSMVIDELASLHANGGSALEHAVKTSILSLHLKYRSSFEDRVASRMDFEDVKEVISSSFSTVLSTLVHERREIQDQLQEIVAKQQASGPMHQVIEGRKKSTYFHKLQRIVLISVILSMMSSLRLVPWSFRYALVPSFLQRYAMISNYIDPLIQVFSVILLVLYEALVMFVASLVPFGLSSWVSAFLGLLPFIQRIFTILVLYCSLGPIALIISYLLLVECERFFPLKRRELSMNLQFLICAVICAIIGCCVGYAPLQDKVMNRGNTYLFTILLNFIIHDLFTPLKSLITTVLNLTKGFL